MYYTTKASLFVNQEDQTIPFALQAGEAVMSLSNEKMPNMGVTRFTDVSQIIIIKIKAVSVGSKLFPFLLKALFLSIA